MEIEKKERERRKETKKIWHNFSYQESGISLENKLYKIVEGRKTFLFPLPVLGLLARAL